MKIIISGYGKMGHEVERIALNRNHQVIDRIDTAADWKLLKKEEIPDAIIIDFSQPDVALDNIIRCFELGLPIVTGTTGWYDELSKVKTICLNTGGTLFYAPNFSIGVNAFFRANMELAKIMSNIEGYSTKIIETHHVHKLDAPSGTAIKTAEGIIDHSGYKKWVNQETDNNEELEITSKREGEVPGTHEVIYESKVDTIMLRHEANSRIGFALGAVIAAEFIRGKKGVFTMDDLLDKMLK